eukprot:101858-Hanusia_phi.AAC.1
MEASRRLQAVEGAHMCMTGHCSHSSFRDLAGAILLSRVYYMIPSSPFQCSGPPPFPARTPQLVPPSDGSKQLQAD